MKPSANSRPNRGEAKAFSLGGSGYKRLSASDAALKLDVPTPSKFDLLPSLAAHSPSLESISLSEMDFALTKPVFRRMRYDVFGMDELQFSRKDLRTPVSMKEEIEAAQEIKRKQQEEKFITLFRPSLEEDLKLLDSRKKTQIQPSAQSERDSRSRRGGRRREGPNQGYNIKSQKFGQFMKSDNERKDKLDFAVQRKKDRKDDILAQRKSIKPGSSSSKRVTASIQSVAVNFTEEESDIGIPRSISVENIEQSNDALRGVYDQYFGEKALTAFHEKYKRSTLDLERYPKEEELPEELKTPRSLYLRGVAKAKLLPLPLLIRDPTEPLSLNLGFKGLGDIRVAPVIEVIDKIPALHTINLADNRLTDATLMPLALKLPLLTSLTQLDLSFNKIDDSSETIMDYLRDENCKLRTLILNGADVDDEECVNICLAISHNKSLRTLSLSKNLIGKSELLNVLHPDLQTGGEAVGDMLKVNTTLTKLDLSWNAIRMDSAIALAKSLEVNQTLKTLLLGYNSFGDMPSQYLGRALKFNKCLTELDIESNSINPKAATVLANAISFNETLLKLNINGNTLGKIGAQALVAAIQRSSTESRKLQVSFINCDCIKDDDNIFSAANPHGTWRMNLREPYGQMVAAECLYLANYKAGCRIVKLLYNGNLVTLERSYVASAEEGEEGAMKKFKLEEFYKNCRLAAVELLAGNFTDGSKYLNNLLTQFGFKMDEDNRLIVLKKTQELWNAKAKREGRDVSQLLFWRFFDALIVVILQSQDLHEVFLYEIFYALFVINDVDMSGTMELDEFIETLISLGKSEYDRDAAKRLMGEYDRDDSGTIDANEFGTIMLNEFCRTEIPRGELVDTATGQPWEIPSTGYCVIQLSYQCDVPTLFDIGADHGIDNIIKSIREAKTDDQREILFQNTTSSPYFFLSFEQAQLLFEEMQGLNRLPLELMCNIMPQIVNEEQANKFADTNLNELGKLALRIKMGQLYCAFVGLLTGHYAIDLKDPSQRNGGRRLGAISVTEGKACRQGGVISSQKGNFANFRNEKLGVMPVDVTGRWFSSANASQNTKVLHLDYVSTQKPRKGTPPMSDSRFDKLVQQLNLEEIKKVWDRIKRKESQFLENQAHFPPADGDDSSIEGDPRANAALQNRRTTRQASLIDLMSESLRPNTHIPAGLTPLVTNSGYTLNYAEFPELIMEPPYSVSSYHISYSLEDVVASNLVTQIRSIRL